VVGYPTEERVSILRELLKFVGGKITFVERKESKILIKPLLDLDEVRIDMYNKSGEFLQFWKFENMKRNIEYFLIFEDDSLLTGSLLISSTKKDGEISMIKFN
jgi:hypothetical protein